MDSCKNLENFEALTELTHLIIAGNSLLRAFISTLNKMLNAVPSYVLMYFSGQLKSLGIHAFVHTLRILKHTNNKMVA